MRMIKEVCSGDVGAIKKLSYMREVEKELGNYAGGLSDLEEEVIQSSGD